MVGVSPPQDPIEGGNVNNSNENENPNKGETEDINNESQSEISIAAGNADDDDTPVGLIITFVLLSIMVCVMLTLFFRAKSKNNEAKQNPRSATAIVAPHGYDDDLNKVYDVSLDDEDSVDTEESDTFIAVEDGEGRLAGH